MAPTWIGTGDLDLFYEESLDYAKRLREAGVACELEIVAGAPHAFDIIKRDTKQADIMRESALKFVRGLDLAD